MTVELLLLGTGAADGWPNPFCRCESCGAARRAGVRRRPTAAVLDGRVLLDAGPGIADGSREAGVDLADVELVLVTHAHNDHLDPSFLLHRSWVSERPLTLAGPRPVIEACRDWLAPDQDTVTLREVTAGQRFVHSSRSGDVVVHVLPAVHEAFGEAVLYAVESGGRSLLWATDTGRWAPGWRERLGQSGVRLPLDLLVMEETFGDAERLGGGRHLGFAGFAAHVHYLRAGGVIDERTDVVAVHLSHHNPDESELAARLAVLGAVPGRDGMQWRV